MATTEGYSAVKPRLTTLRPNHQYSWYMKLLRYKNTIVGNVLERSNYKTWLNILKS